MLNLNFEDSKFGLSWWMHVMNVIIDQNFIEIVAKYCAFKNNSNKVTSDWQGKSPRPMVPQNGARTPSFVGTEKKIILITIKRGWVLVTVAKPEPGLDTFIRYGDNWSTGRKVIVRSRFTPLPVKGRSFFCWLIMWIILQIICFQSFAILILLEIYKKS